MGIVSDSQKKAAYRYQRTHTKNVTFQLNTEYDKDILDKLASVPNKQGYIKALIRADIASGTEGVQKAE